MTAQVLPLRNYQTAAIAELEKAWAKGLTRPAVVLPTGAGKTVVFAHLARRRFESDGTRTLVIVHTSELVDQAIDKLRTVAPGMTVGKMQGPANQWNTDVVVGTVQTLRSERRLALLRGRIGLVVVDECHHAAATSYQTVLEALACRAAGFTATMVRGDGAALGDVWEQVVYRRDITDMIKVGHLLPARGKRIRVPDLDLRNVKRTAGEYRADELADALGASLAPELVAKAYVEHASDRSGVLFAPTVESAYLFADALNGAGVISETVHGALPRDERAAILRRLKNGHTQVVSNCQVLTEGFDEPRVSCAVICRPTTSTGLYVQMVGRVLRPYPGQREALVLDVVGVSGRHRLASLVDLVGDPALRRSEDDEESLADLLLDEDGFSFEEFEDDGPAGTGSRPIEWAEGDRYEVIDVDLFARSHSAWLRSNGGTWFLSAGKHTVFIAPSGGGGRYNVAVCDSAGRGEFRYRRIELDAAMSWGEEVVKELGGNALISRKSGWRKKKDGATDAQLMMARRLGIEVNPLISKVDLSDRISEHKTTALIDPIVREWTRV